MKISGKITKVLQKITGQKKDSSGEWVKQSFVIDTGEQYNNIICFETFGADKVEKFNQYNNVGDSVDVEFNINCNEWEGKYYTSLQSWKVFKANVNSEFDATASDADMSDDNSGLPF